MKNPWVITGILAVILFGGAIWFSNSTTAKNNEGVTTMSHYKGSETASVKLVEFSDFQCPACQAFQPALNEALAQYGDSIQFEYKHFPLPIHPFALQAAVAAEAAGQQGQFFEFHDMLFENQPTWSNSATPNALFIGYAEELGLDLEQFNRQMKSTVLKDKVRAEMQEGRELGVSGTPTFFLNGERMQIETYEDFIVQIGLAINPDITFDENAAATQSSGIEFGI